MYQKDLGYDGRVNQVESKICKEWDLEIKIEHKTSMGSSLGPWIARSIMPLAIAITFCGNPPTLTQFQCCFTTGAECLMFAKVASTENSIYVEIPTNEDGIRYRCKSTGHLRGTWVFDDQLQLPLGVTWSDNVFHCVYEETGKKLENPNSNVNNSLSEKFQLKTFDMIALGLPDDITDESFYRYFSKFGKLKMCELRKNLKKPKSKGYGFLRYVNFDDQSECIRTEHVIGNTTVCLRLPTAKMDSSTCKRKLFVTNITPSVTQEHILEYFNVFGKIVEIFMPPASNPHAFLTFEAEESILRIFRFGESHRVFGGYVVVERVYTKQEMLKLGTSKMENNGHIYSNDLYDNTQFNREPSFDECITKAFTQSNCETPLDRYQHNFDYSFAQQSVFGQVADQHNYYYPHQYQHEEYNYDQQNSEHQHKDQFAYDVYQSQTVHPDQGYHRHCQSQYLDDHQNQLYPDSTDSYQSTDFNYTTELQQFPSNSLQDPSITNQQFPQKLYENLPIHNYQTDNQTFSNQSFIRKNVPNQQYLQRSIPQNSNAIVNQNSPYSYNPVHLKETNNSEIGGNMTSPIISEIVYRVLEQASLPSEKDILVKLLIEQLLSPKPNTTLGSPCENDAINLEKLIKLVQNPNVLDSIIQMSENKLGDVFNRNK